MGCKGVRHSPYPSCQDCQQVGCPAAALAQLQVAACTAVVAARCPGQNARTCRPKQAHQAPERACVCDAQPAAAAQRAQQPRARQQLRGWGVGDWVTGWVRGRTSCSYVRPARAQGRHIRYRMSLPPVRAAGGAQPQNNDAEGVLQALLHVWVPQTARGRSPKAGDLRRQDVLFCSMRNPREVAAPLRRALPAPARPRRSKVNLRCLLRLRSKVTRDCPRVLAKTSRGPKV